MILGCVTYVILFLQFLGSLNCDIVHRRPWKPGNLSSKTSITEYFLSVQQNFFLHIYFH